jgi:CheY-like chemotaxis protein
VKTARILLVEDNRGDIVVVKLSLKRHGIEHALHVVNDGDQALQFIERMGASEDAPFPDLLLLDLNLPRVDGRDVLRAFRSRPDCAHIPVIVFTSSDAPSDREEVAALGIEYYFKKPTDFEAFMEIGAVIGRYLAENENSAEACAL